MRLELSLIDNYRACELLNISSYPILKALRKPAGYGTIGYSETSTIKTSQYNGVGV